MRRRKFITLLGGAAAAWPFAARAQRPAIPVIGFLNGASEAAWTAYTEACRRGLNEAGYVEGQNVIVEYRWAEGQHDRLPSMAAELVRRRVDVIVASGGAVAAVAAKAATKTIPIVFTSGDADPVRIGLVDSLNRPGGNATGAVMMAGVLGAKRLQLLHQMAPKIAAVAALINPKNIEVEAQWADIKAAADSIGMLIHRLNATNENDLVTAFVALAQLGAGALIVLPDPNFSNWRDQLATLAARYKIPTIHYNREFVSLGGLMSYGTSIAEVYCQVGIYTGRILKGAKPADLPVLQPTKFDLVINLKTAKALGLEIPPSQLALADEVIE